MSIPWSAKLSALYRTVNATGRIQRCVSAKTIFFFICTWIFISPSFSSPGFLAWNFPANVPVCNAYRTICGGSVSDDVWEVGSGCLGPPRGDAWLPAKNRERFGAISRGFESALFLHFKQHTIWETEDGGGDSFLFTTLKWLGGYSLELPNCPPPSNSHSQDYLIFM